MQFASYTPRGGTNAMSANPVPCLVHRRGNSLGITLAKEVRRLLSWRVGDFVAVRVLGDKVVIERIALEGMSRIRTGEPQAYETALEDSGRVTR